MDGVNAFHYAYVPLSGSGTEALAPSGQDYLIIVSKCEQNDSDTIGQERYWFIDGSVNISWCRQVLAAERGLHTKTVWGYLFNL